MNNIRNMILGICEITDGIIRLFSLGFVHTSFGFKWLVWWELKVELPKQVEKMKKDK